MTAYESYHDGKMNDYIPTDEELQKGFDSLPEVPEKYRTEKARTACARFLFCCAKFVLT